MLEGKSLRQIDWKRNAKGVLVGSLFSGWLHTWWGALELHASRVVPISAVGRYAHTAYKVAWDQLFSATIFNVLYVSTVSLGSGQSMAQCMDRIRTQVPGQMLIHWSFWGPFHMGNFMYMPLDYRVITMNVVKVAWSGFMSYRLQSCYDEDQNQDDCGDLSVQTGHQAQLESCSVEPAQQPICVLQQAVESVTVALSRRVMAGVERSTQWAPIIGHAECEAEEWTRTEDWRLAAEARFQ